MYQIQFKLLSKTHTYDIEAKSHEHLLDLFSDLSACEVTEIRKYKHIDKTPTYDDGNYRPFIKFKVWNEFRVMSIKIPKIKKNLTYKEIENLLVSVVLLDGQKKYNYQVISSTEAPKN